MSILDYVVAFYYVVYFLMSKNLASILFVAWHWCFFRQNCSLVPFPIITSRVYHQKCSISFKLCENYSMIEFSLPGYFYCAKLKVLHFPPTYVNNYSDQYKTSWLLFGGAIEIGLCTGIQWDGCMSVCVCIVFFKKKVLSNGLWSLLPSY